MRDRHPRNGARCQELVGKSLAVVSALAPLIGYDAARGIAYEAVASGKTVRGGAAQECAYSRATQKSFGAWEHDHAATRNRSKAERAKLFFFCYKPGIN
jgi:fumarate hydratase class II